MYREVTGWCQKPGSGFQPGACPRSTTDEHSVRELKAKRPFPTLGRCMEQRDRRSKDGSLLSQVFALQGPGYCSRTEEASPLTYQGSPSPLAQHSGPCPGNRSRVPHTPTPALLGGHRGSGRPCGSPGPQHRLGLQRAIGAGPGRCPRPPLAHRSSTPPARGEASPVQPALCSARPPPPSSGVPQRGGGALPPAPGSQSAGCGQRSCRAAPEPAPLRSAPLGSGLTPESARQAGSRAGGAQGEGCAQMSAGPARCCTPSSPPEGGSSRCLRRLLLFCKGCCCRWTQPSPDMELLLSPPPLLLLE